MSLVVATQVSAVATAVLAAFAIVTAVFAILAFRKQSAEVATLQGQARDQSEQLGLQRTQLDEQRKINEKQTSVLELQAQELRESLDERKREAEQRHQGQAARVTAWLDLAQSSDPDLAARAGFGAYIRNASDLPVFDVRAFFFFVDEIQPGGDWQPAARGGPVERVRVLPPREDRWVGMPEKVRGMFPGEVTKRSCVVGIEFTDAAGNKWERDPRGALIPRS